jgi:hypothetical protein
VTGENIFPLQVRKLLEQAFDCVTAGQVFEERLEWITQPSYARFAVAYLRIYRYPSKQIFIRHAPILHRRGLQADFSGLTELKG